MIVHSYRQSVRLDALVRETREIVRGWDWASGAFGHALSLPRYGDLHPWRRYSYENFPCTGVLARCHALREVFDSFDCEKVSFRLLRRPPGSAYAWHTDAWKGPGVVRFQIPILSDAEAFLIITDYDRIDQLRGGQPRHLDEASFAAFAGANEGHFVRHYLSPGLLHYFDTTRVHTLVNAGRAERITLTFDLVANEWLRARYPAIATEIGAGPAAPLPRPGALRRGLLFARSRLFPLRNRMRGWRTSTDARPQS